VAGTNRADRLALAGYSVAAAGVLVFSLLDAISNLRLGSSLLDVAATGSMAAVLVGFTLASVGSARWARRDHTHAPLKLSALIAVVVFVATWAIGVNIHGPSAILMFVVLFAAINVVIQLIAAGY